MKSYIVSLFTLLSCVILYAQKDSETLLTINDEAITVGEFKGVYLKNSELLEDNSKKDPEAYLELFIPYKLKVQEAYKKGLDNREAYKEELAGYKKQLAKTHLTDVSISNKLVREAYDRSVTEVKARHILVNLASNATPRDTLKAYNRIIEARNKVLAGEDFGDIARTYSDGPSGKANGGDLGWFKAFKMLYAFENKAYETAVGDVSMPFKTRFGYHIVQTTDKREALGARQVAHIMILEKQKDTTINPSERIKKIYDLLQKGEDFASLAKTYSDDTNTSAKGGVVRKFERGQLSSATFEDKAFGLKEIGDYSEPFKTKFGWHIMKLVEHFPVQSFEEQRSALESKVKKDKRSQVISEVLTTKLKKLYNTQDLSGLVQKMSDPATGTFDNDKWVFSESAIASEKAFVLKDSVYTIAELARFLERSYNPGKYPNKQNFFKESTRQYVDLKTQAYHEAHLEEIDPKFNNILREYKEGLLIFDLMTEQIWDKARTDTVGLERYYEKEKTRYKEPKKAIATVYTSQEKINLEKLRTILNNNATKELETLPESVLKSNKDLYFKDNTAYAAGYKPQLGVSEVLPYNSGFVLYQVPEIKEERIKTLDEAKGALITDYQQELEKQWITQLRSNATIAIKKKVLKKVVKQLK